jgi:hypothetical protein
MYNSKLISGAKINTFFEIVPPKNLKYLPKYLYFFV